MAKEVAAESGERKGSDTAAKGAKGHDKKVNENVESIDTAAEELSVAQLEKMLGAKRSVLEGLQRRRARLAKQLQEIEARIAAVGGSGVVRSGNAGRKRPRNTQTLLQVVLDVLKESKKPISLGEISRRVLSSGYKTGAAKFENTVYQCLYNNSDKIHHDLAARTYRIK